MRNFLIINSLYLSSLFDLFEGVLNFLFLLLSFVMLCVQLYQKKLTLKAFLVDLNKFIQDLRNYKR